MKYTTQQLEEVIRRVKITPKQAADDRLALEVMQNYNGADKLVSVYDLYDKIKNETQPEINIHTGLPSLDKCTTGINPGNLVVISAPTGAGKTKLCETITAGMIRQKIYSTWFTFEVPPRQLITRFGLQLPMFYLPQEITDNTLEWVERRIVEGIAKYDTKAVFIDHLHYLLPPGKIVNSSLELGGIVRQIKLMAIKHDVAIFLVAHTRKAMGSEKLTLDSIRDSSFIAQEADFVFMLDREKDDSHGTAAYTDLTVLAVLKNRKTGASTKIGLTLKDSLFVETILNNE